MVYDKEYYEKNKEKFKLWAKNYKIKNREKYNETKKKWRHGKGKIKEQISKQKSDAKYYSKIKNTPEFKQKKSEYQKQYYQRIKEHHKQIMKKHRSKPEVKKNIAQYNQKWHKDNPEKQLASNKRQLQKLGDVHGLTWVKLLHHLRGWAQIIHKDCNETCQVCSQPSAEAHHIFHKKDYPLLAFNRNNGIALCIRCHNQVHGKRLLESVV